MKARNPLPGRHGSPTHKPRAAGTPAGGQGSAVRRILDATRRDRRIWHSQPRSWIKAVADNYLRLLTDRDIVVIRNGQHEATRLRAWLDGHDGPMPTYQIELVARAGSYMCPYTARLPTCSRR